MFERMISWGLLKYADYTALDVQEENIACARQALPQWASHHGYHCQVNPAGSLVLTGEALKVSLQLEEIEIHEFIARQQGQERWDLLVAHAFLDLLDISR